MKIALLGGLPKASGDLAPRLTPEPGPAGERVSLHGWMLEVEFNDHPSIPSLARSMLSCSVPPSLTLSGGGCCSKSHIRLQRPCFRGLARRGARRGGRRRLVSPCVGRDRGGQIVPRGRNPANEGGRVASVRVCVCPVGGPASRSLALKCFPKLFYYPDIVDLRSSPPEFGSHHPWAAGGLAGSGVVWGCELNYQSLISPSRGRAPGGPLSP